MDRGLATVIGMSIAYAASFVGLAFAWVGWKKRHGRGRRSGEAGREERDPGGPEEEAS